MALPSVNIHRLSLQGRLRLFFLLGMGASALIVVLVVAVVGDLYRRDLLAKKTDELADALSSHMLVDAQGRLTGFDPQVIKPWILSSLAAEIPVRVADDQGRIHYTNGEPHLLVKGPPGRAAPAASGDFLHNGAAMYLTTRVTEQGGRRWTVQVAASDRLVGLMRDAFGAPGMRRGVLAMSAVFLAVFLLSFQWLLRRSLAPLHAASQAAQRISPSALGERLDATAQPAEIQPLVEAFNQALDRLQHGFEAQQQFLANAAHELKTPLALVRAQVELGHRPEGRARVLADIDRMARQVQQLLLLAETSEPLNYQRDRIDPHPILEEVCDVMARVADRRSVILQLQVDPALQTWNADRGALFTLLKNLLENAIQHSSPGDVVTLRAAVDGFGVQDQGPGVAPQHLSRIFERFWRGPGRRDEGAGLGLSICGAIASAHGWRINARALPRGLWVGVEMGEALTSKSEAAASQRPPAAHAQRFA
ncbi:sensor histidine kinase [Roseateles amylovorans]|uniref:histidine kinase n=1 Tax=Roseateles amylovorans TaxID=2978473 RepID=A0ABY6B012_9BURK|nr:ATP-binding protein [Roseateles amylovorans]UXH78385.1 ATP-binding protein [Roseateles amylovorans]